MIAAAEEKRIDAILMGSVEKDSNEQKEITSSTFRSVILNARCTVILVNEKMIEQLYKLA